jgi:hypothetical protein
MRFNTVILGTDPASCAKEGQPHQTAHLLPAFGLMEIAIVLIIIGLIAGFALKGVQLIDNAKLKTVMTDVEQVRLSTLIFQDQHHSLPGDYDGKSHKFSETTPYGNGDGQIDGTELGIPTGESASFWSHLAASEIMGSLKASTNDALKPGVHYPLCKIGGALTISNTVDGHSGPWSGPWIVLAIPTSPHLSPGLTPEQAAQLDNTHDDGSPTSGLIRAIGKATAGPCVQDDAYNLSLKEKTCIVLFKL